MFDELYNDTLQDSLSNKNVTLKTLPISSNFLFDFLNNYKQSNTEKYNNCFTNDNIPDENNISVDYLNNILGNNNINYNTISKVVNQLKKKSILSSKILVKIEENKYILNILKDKLSKLDKQKLSYNSLNNILENINILKFEKLNLEKLYLLNKYLYLLAIEKIYSINNNKLEIINKCNSCEQELNNNYNISPKKYNKLQNTLTDFDNYLNKQYGGNVSDKNINAEMKQLSPKIQKAFEFFKIKDESAIQLKVLENKLQSMCKDEKDVNKCIDKISNRLTDYTSNNEQIEELEQNLSDTQKTLKQKENMLNQIKGKSEADFIKFKDELSVDFKELEDIKNKEISTFKDQIQELATYKDKYDEQLKKNRDNDSLAAENQDEISILNAKVSSLDNSKNVILTEYNDLVNSGNEYKIKYELKEKELDYINEMYSDVADREVKLREKSLEYDKLKTQYSKLQSTISEFGKNLDVIADNKKKLLDRLRSLEDMNLLLSNNTFGNIFKDPIDNTNNDSIINDLNKRRSALENILNSFKYTSTTGENSTEQNKRYATYQNTIGMFVQALDFIKNHVESDNFQKLQNNKRISSNLLYNNDIDEIYNKLIDNTDGAMNWKTQSINIANTGQIITEVITKLQVMDNLNKIQEHTHSFMKNKIGDPYSTARAANISTIGVNQDDWIPNDIAGSLLSNIDGTAPPANGLPSHLTENNIRLTPDFNNANLNGINNLKDQISIIYYHIKDLKSNPTLITENPNSNVFSMNTNNPENNDNIQKRLGAYIEEKNTLTRSYTDDLYNQIQYISETNLSRVDKERLYNNATNTVNDNINNIDNILKIKYQVDPNAINNQSGGINQNSENIDEFVQYIVNINNILNQQINTNIHDINNTLINNNSNIKNSFLNYINFNYDKNTYNKNDIIFLTWHKLIENINQNNYSINNIDQIKKHHLNIFDIYQEQLHERLNNTDISYELQQNLHHDITILQNFIENHTQAGGSGQNQIPNFIAPNKSAPAPAQAPAP